MRKEIESSAPDIATVEKERALEELSLLATKVSLLRALHDKLSSHTLGDVADIQQKIVELKAFNREFIERTFCDADGLLKSEEEILDRGVLDNLKEEMDLELKAYHAAFSIFIETYTFQFLLLLDRFEIERTHVFEEMLQYTAGVSDHLNLYYTLKFSSFSEQKDDDVEELFLTIQQRYSVKKRKINTETNGLFTFGIYADTQEKSGFTARIESIHPQFS